MGYQRRVHGNQTHRIVVFVACVPYLLEGELFPGSMQCNCCAAISNHLRRSTETTLLRPKRTLDGLDWIPSDGIPSNWLVNSSEEKESLRAPNLISTTSLANHPTG